MRFLPAIEGIVPYTPGTPIESVMRQYGLTEVVKLASNEFPLPPLAEVKAAVMAAFDEVNRYPDGDCLDLRQALAALFGRRLEEVAVGNGMDDLLELLGDALLDHGDEVVFADPSFMLYEDVCMRRDAKAVLIPLLPDFAHDLDAMAAAVTPRTKLVIVCNPNNPTGNYIPAADLTAFVDKVPEDVLVVIDEAYNEFVSADDREDTLQLQAERPNVCLFRTFSKAYGLAGLRVAYGLCPEVVRGALDKVRQPFNVNRLAQVAALEALKHQDQILERRRMVIEMREYLENALASMGRAVVPSQTNFVLVSIEGLSVPQEKVCEALMVMGVIVRDGNGLGCPGWARVSTGTRYEMDFFLDRLRSLEPHTDDGQDGSA
jgi:histidinol-phosphate aminotransferase